MDSPVALELDLRRQVQSVVDDLLDHNRAVLAELGPDVVDLLDAVGALLSGGKRLRASFCYWGYRAGGGADGRPIITLATAMELFQAAALLHDDVMDDSDTRRGRPAAHRELAARHRSRGWSGDPDRFGLAGAVLAGNLCLQWTDDLYAGCGLSPGELIRARDHFDRMRTQLMAGQYLDVVESARPWADLATAERIARAERVIRYKSAKYSVEQPLLIGASAAGAGERVQAALSAYGLAVGEGFQLRDDLLGVFGDPEQTGKPAGDDLREGKRTVLIAHALDRADVAGAGAIEAALGDPDLTVEQVQRVRDVMVECGAVDRVEVRIGELAQAGYDALDTVSADLTPVGVAALRDLVAIATDRKT